MTIYDRDGVCICNANVIWLYTDHLSKILMGLVYLRISPSAAALIQKPQVTILRRKWGGNSS